VTTAQENEILTRTGPGTPMGALFRRYWLPVLLASEIAEPDGPPVRVKLLSERLLAFRDTHGRIGLIDEFCAHRGVSLWFGRNEECGIRCAYHGWKYDVNGQCVDVPSEPDESGFCRKIRLTSYPCIERGGVVWAYMGPAEQRPPEPAYEWTSMAPASRHVSKRIQECNYLQALEGGLDSIHSTFLHRYSVGDDPLLKRDPQSAAMLKGDAHPVFLPTVSAGGLHVSTRRNVGDDRYFWRVTQFLMPCFNLFPPYGDNPSGGHAFVPIDDASCWIFSIDYHPRRELSELEQGAAAAGYGIHVPIVPGTFMPVANKSNDYLIDRAAQRARKTFSGVLRIGIQDAAVQESMGPIEDRSRESLVSTDNGIIMTRRRLLDAARASASAEGRDPPGLDPAAQRVRAVSMVAPRDVPFAKALAEHQPVSAAAEAAE
jgi:nitrite reductase/ring-hydroxylating ferredoxin subunit